jgi:hypothetical protein
MFILIPKKERKKRNEKMSSFSVQMGVKFKLGPTSCDLLTSAQHYHKYISKYKTKMAMFCFKKKKGVTKMSEQMYCYFIQKEINL